MISKTVLSQLYRCIGAVLCTASLAGCTVGPDFMAPDSGLSKVVLAPRQDYMVPLSISEVKVPTKWWLLFNDPLLATLQMRAQDENLDLQLASERIEQSRAQLGIASSQLQPRVAASSRYTRERLSEHGKFVALGAPAGPSDFWQIGFDAGWEIDLWGRARRVREGAAASMEAIVYDREAVRVSISAEVARTYLQLRGIQSQLDIAQENLIIAQRTLRLAESRVRNGVATRFETSSASAQLATTKATVPELVAHRNLLMNALALLLGEKPRALDAELRKGMPLPSIPTRIPVGIPSELAHRRPDILSAEAQLHAATAAIGAAKADFYPRIGLKGRVGVEAFESGDLDSWDSRLFSIGPTIYLPIFQGGRLMQRLALNEARQKSAAIAYRQTVLRAWHEVDNALDAWAAQQSQYGELRVSYEQNKQALHIAERGYQQGVADYLSVLTAQRNLLASQTRLNASATDAALTVVNLYKSLGGGWDPDGLNTEPRITDYDSANTSASGQFPSSRRSAPDRGLSNE
ncbi:efflux transporter outer membrane subunit [Pollutimonas harenae]|uniref:Efflux transporter outer membrane subunit n=1 Tax=Pollutimonas harenae TaxID=657015 RepID=A0A853H0N7_9BURK|nr:efflux transporter outer membrane subunit [Pollutimonas harenae]NYT85289.1 efflux transporter outer membrane subunit [Pollutimonas harenae]TEA72346.1 efflux transporter outer membrane subunit [Pollutimonas harenae]